MTTEQAFVEGFVKRAAEHGLSREEALKAFEKEHLMRELAAQKASVPLNAIFNAGTPGGLIHDSVKDMGSPKETPSRLARIYAPGLLGSILGGGLGAGISRGNPLASGIGTMLGGGLGSGLGARSFNKKLDRTIEDIATRQ